MALELNTPDEKIDLGVDGIVIAKFEPFTGRAVDMIPEVRRRGRVLVPTYKILDRRVKHSELSDWRDNYFFTADSFHMFKDGSGKIVLDDELLERVDSNSSIVNGGVVSSEEDWERLFGEKVMNLSAERVREISGKSYTQKSVKDSPEWNFLARGSDRLRAYADSVFPEIKSKFSCKEGMAIYLPNYKVKHAFWAWCVGRLGGRSNADGRIDLDLGHGRLLGELTPEAWGRVRKIQEAVKAKG